MVFFYCSGEKTAAYFRSQLSQVAMAAVQT